MVALDKEFTMAVEELVDEKGNRFSQETDAKGNPIKVTWVSPGPDAEQQAAFNRAGAVKVFTPQSKTWDMLLDNIRTFRESQQEMEPGVSEQEVTPAKKDNVINSRAELSQLAQAAQRTYGSAFPKPEQVAAAKGTPKPAPTSPVDTGREQVGASKDAVKESQDYRQDQATYAKDTAAAKEKGLATGAVTTRAGLEAAANLDPKRGGQIDEQLAAQKGSPAAYVERQELGKAQQGPTPARPSQTPTAPRPAAEMDPGVSFYMQSGAPDWEGETTSLYSQYKKAQQQPVR